MAGSIDIADLAGSIAPRVPRAEERARIIARLSDASDLLSDASRDWEEHLYMALELRGPLDVSLRDVLTRAREEFDAAAEAATGFLAATEEAS